MVATPTKTPPPYGAKPETLNRIDMSKMTQSELYALSLSSSTAFDLSPTNNVVIPEIDRTIFNESAASRGQTHSRNRRNSSAVVGRRIRLPGHTRATLTPSPNDPAIADGKSIVKHLKNLLFGAEPENPPADQSPPPPPAVTLSEEVGIVGFSGERKRKRRSRNTGVADLSGEGNRKRRRKEKEVVVVEEEEGGEIELEIVNKEGVVVDFRDLEKCDQVFDEEFKKRTIGLETEEEFLRFMGGLEGKWGSTRKKRRIVDASEFADAFPIGWKLLLALKRQQYRPFLFCRRYIRLLFLLLMPHLHK